MARLRLALLAGLIVAVTGVLAAQDAKSEPPAPGGLWKLTVLTMRESEGRPLLLVKVTEKGGKWNMEIAATALTGKPTLENVSVGKDKWRFTVKWQAFSLPCEFKLPASRKVAKLYGEATFRKMIHPAEMERTTLSSLDLFEQNKETLAKEPLGVNSIALALALMRQAEEKKAKAADVRSWAERAVKSAELYGPGVQRDVLLGVASTLGEQKGFEAVALQYARRAERLLAEKEKPAVVKKVMEVLADVLEKAGKTDEAKKVLARIKGLDFRVKLKTYSGRKGKSNRVVLAEVFTGSQAKVAAATTMATAGLLKTFKPTEVAVVEYHLPAPLPDPLACTAAEERREFYDKAVKSIPVVLLNGKVAMPGGGEADDAQDRYDGYVEAIEPLLEEDARAELSVKATRKGDKVIITAEVSPVTSKDDVRLRLVLAEPRVSYKGGSGRTVHYNVARAMPGGAEGTVVKGKGLKKTFTVDLAQVRKDINAYLDKMKEKEKFPDKQRPMEMKELRVIAFVQNDDKGEVLQAVMVDVPGK
jgi:hypothetical protein